VATTIKSILERVVSALSDEGSVTWTLQDLVRYVNDGQRDMLVKRPDLFVVEVDHPLVMGVRQALPANGAKLLDIPCNTSGLPITRVKRALLDAQAPGWRVLPGADEIDHFTYDEDQPKQFEVYPPAALGAAVRLEYSAVPADLPIPAAGVALADLGGNVNVPDLQATALHHYICFRCYAEGDENVNAERAQQFLALFSNLLDVEMVATTSSAPKNQK
jgi:hypothetical protein